MLSQTEVRGGQTFVTTYTYSYDETAKKRTVVTEVRAGTTLTSKSKSIVYEVKPNTNPDESIRYDENDNRIGAIQQKNRIGAIQRRIGAIQQKGE